MDKWIVLAVLRFLQGPGSRNIILLMLWQLPSLGWTNLKYVTKLTRSLKWQILKKTKFPGWLKNQDGKTIIKIMKTFRWPPVMVTKVQMQPGAQVLRLLWWPGNPKDQVTKVARWWSAQIAWQRSHFLKCTSPGSWRKYTHLSRAQSDPRRLFCFLPRLLCADWLGSALKACRTLTSGSWSSPGWWTLSYSAATWRRVLCS